MIKEFSVTLSELLLDLQLNAYDSGKQGIKVSESEYDYKDAHEEIMCNLQLLITQLIGEDYDFTRPKEDYLPHAYTHLKAKNQLREDQRRLAVELFGDYYDVSSLSGEHKTSQRASSSNHKHTGNCRCIKTDLTEAKS